MNKPDFAAAHQYALTRLAQELPPTLFYHTLQHTRDDVYPAAERFAEIEDVHGAELLLLRTAVLFHDLGFVVQQTDHEAIGINIVQNVLPDFGYSSQQIESIVGMIMATKLPQTPHNLLEEIIADADLDVLGRDDFWPRNQALRDELTAFGMPFDDEAWYTGQLKFLQTHHYFTAAAHQLRGAKKEQHIAEMAARLHAVRQREH